MAKVTRSVGRAVAGVVTVAAACAPMSVELEHRGSGGTGASGAEAGMSSLGEEAGTTAQGSGGRGGTGETGATVGGTAGTRAGGTGGAQGTNDEAGQGPSEGTAATCGDGVLSDVRNGHDLLPGYTAAPDPRVAAWVSSMSLADQITQMQGVPGDSKNWNDLQRSEDLPLADGTVLRGFKYRAGPRGLSLKEQQPDRMDDGNDFATAFPAPSIRGASWDLELEWRIGDAIGDETTASKNDLVLGPGADILRHPFWGRAQDAYGEDTYHVGRMGTAFAAGVQAHVGACATHFISSGIEIRRSSLNAVADEATLRDIHARPFEMLVKDGGVACVMAAYGQVNGVPATENSHLLRDILKAPQAEGGFGFRGFVISDWWASPGGQGSVTSADAEANAVALANAGLDVELPWIINYGALARVVQGGQVAPTVIAEAASRVLEQKARFHTALTTDGFGLRAPSSSLSGGSIATNQDHLALAEEAELESAVLLANGTPDSPVLPIHDGIESIAVIGADLAFQLMSTTNPKSCPDSKAQCTFHFATDVALGDRGTNGVNADPAESVGPFVGIKSAAGAHGVSVTSGNGVAAASDADLVVVVVGLTPGDEGEEYTVTTGGDRKTLDLPANQAQLVSDALALDKPTVIVVESGGLVNLPWLTNENRNQATIWAGYGGMRAGAALGKLLFGDANFGGKLPIAWPEEAALSPLEETSTSTTLSYFVGYRDYDHRGIEGPNSGLVFPFGYGLSYTTFAYSDPVVPCAEVTDDAVLDVTVNVANTGPVSGDEVAFLFVAGPHVTSEPRSVKELKSFARVSLEPGAKQLIHLPVRMRDLRHVSATTNAFSLDTGDYTVLVGPSGDDRDLSVAGTFTVPAH